MEPKKQRKRIAYEKKGMPAIEDELEFKANKCSGNAKRIIIQEENIQIDLWFDKHYHDRYQHGDENGKRVGIDSHIVKELVLRSFKHLILYSSLIKGFTFLNHPAIATNSARVVLQEFIDEAMLNVVIEVHFVDIYTYEVTVKTAMSTDHFRISDGQYAIELDGDSSILKKCERGTLKEIISI